MAKPEIASGGRKQAFRAGFRAMLPLWIGAFPFALAYTIAAHKAGLDAVEIGLMSLLLGSATVQVSLVNFIVAQAPVWLIFLTTFSLSAQLILYGMVLQQRFRFSKRERLLMGGFLTDAAYALTLNGPRPGYFLLGAELSMYFAWNIGTSGGVFLQNLIPNPTGKGFEFIFPLMFLVVLVPLVNGRVALLIVGVAAVTALLGGLFLPAGLNILVTAVITGLVGMALSPLPQSQKVNNAS